MNDKELIEKIYGMKDAWEAARTDTKMVFAAEVEWALQSIHKSDSMLKYALGNPQATFDAVLNIAAIGVSLNPAKKLAYILPRDGKLTFDCSYLGLIDIAISSGSIKWAQAHRVYESEVPDFLLMGYDEPPRHKRNPWLPPDKRGPVAGAYVVVKTLDGDYLTSTMQIDEIHAIRERSSAWKSYLATQKDAKPKLCPWNTDPEEMEKKTVVKNAYKYWPRTDRLDQAIHYLNTDGGQGIDLAGDAVAKTLLDGLLDELKACTSGTAVATLWARGRASLKEAGDVPSYEKFREAVAKRNKELGVAPPQPTTAPVATPAPTPAPAKALTYAQVSERIKEAKDYAQIEACGPLIDALPTDQQGPLNEFFNERLEQLKKELG